MIVYMLFNEATEQVYVGQTRKSLNKRVREHVIGSKRGMTKLHAAIREWGIDTFTPVVLQHCYSNIELNTAERWWISYTSATEPNVGYNTLHEDKITNRKTSTDMSPEDREVYRQYGLRALKKHSKEYYRECGRRGSSSNTPT